MRAGWAVDERGSGGRCVEQLLFSMAGPLTAVRMKEETLCGLLRIGPVQKRTANGLLLLFHEELKIAKINSLNSSL